MRTKTAQLSVFAVAALAIFAVAAAMLLAGGAPAQADTASLTPDDGAAQQRPQQADPTPTPPRHAPPPACPGETGNPNKTAARVVDSGHIALFDVWWNPEELELTNSSCPPTVTHVPAQDAVPPSFGNPGKEATPARNERSPSSIDIEKTIIHIPSTAKITLSETKYPKTGKYEAVWKADDKETPDTNVPGDGIVWRLPACPDDPATTPLCLSFSADLLNPADWNGNIVYHVDHVHQTDIDKQDPRYVVLYDGTNEEQPRWNTSDARRSKVSVVPDKYNRPEWFFTSRGTYEFQVHITGEPITTKDDPVSKDPSVNGDVREYIIHVGVEADLGITATATPASPSPGNDVTFTITASNAGPDKAPSTSVDVNLPEGLTYSSHAPATATFADSDGDGVWTWDAGSLASKASQTLTVKAKVDKGTRGQKLTTKAAISATETLTIKETVKNEQTGEDEVVEKTYPVPVADPGTDNDVAEATVTVAVAGDGNTAPIFTVTRSVPENSPGKTHVGNLIGVREPDTGNTLTYALTEGGEKQSQFTVSSVTGGAQITVADGAFLDFEVKPTYELVLSVSDGLDASGNDDSSVDHTIGVSIKLEDMPGDPSVRISASATSQTRGEPVTFTATPENLPAGHGTVSYSWIATYVSAPVDQVYSTVYDFHSTWTSRNEGKHSRAGTWHYTVRASWQEEGGITKKILSTNAVTVIWTD